MIETPPDPDMKQPDASAETADAALERGWRRWAAAARVRGDHAVGWLEERRPSNPWIETGFRWLARDKEIAGGVLGGGLAYRFFFWTLALAVLTSGGLGLASRFAANVETGVEKAGLTTAVADTVSAAAQESQSGSVWLLVSGILLFVWFAWGLLRALRLVTAAAWDVQPARFRHLPQGVLGVAAAPFALLLIAGLAGWVRVTVGFLPGLLATLAVGAVLIGFWTWAFWKLHFGGVPWTAHLPGAVLVGLGFEGIHVFTVYFLADKLASTSALYGVLGLSATMLFLLFMIGRVVVWAAELNAVWWEVRHGGHSRPAIDSPA